MNIKTVTPVHNTLSAIQIDHDNMQEVIDYLNNMFGHEFTFTLVEDNWVKWINQASETDPQLTTVVAGDWLVMNFGRLWFLSNFDFLKTYKVV